ncbi:hypothetical protein Tco_0845596 [Tanacetum coccineum]
MIETGIPCLATILFRYNLANLSNGSFSLIGKKVMIEVSKLVIELMNGEKGKEIKKNTNEWKKKAEEACVETGEFTHQRLIRSQGHQTLNGPLPSFRFETIPDGLTPPENIDATQDLLSLVKSVDGTLFLAIQSLCIQVMLLIVTQLLLAYCLTWFWDSHPGDAAKES